VTVVGGPHARCYPKDALKYFDYVLGFTDREVILDVLRDCEPHRPEGFYLSAGKQPAELPGMAERWKFVEQTLRKAPFVQMVPMIGSLGCPYSCGFCIDSSVPYQPLEFGMIKEDLRFLLHKFDRPHVAWHDPNFGVRFDDYMDTIEEAVPSNRMDFIAETTLSLLSEPHVKRLKQNGFKALLPGIESWYDLGNKSRTGATTGLDKVRKVSEHINMILRHIPYVQTNFILGLDGDEGAEPFTLTKTFLDLAPGAFPAYSLITSFGQAAPLNRQFHLDNRILPFPFHFLNNNQAMNVRPKHYSWPEFYDRLIDVIKYSCSPRMIFRRFMANGEMTPRLLNVVRAISSEGFGRIRYSTEIRRRLETDRPFRRFFEQETTEVPSFFVDWMRRDLGPFWSWLPEGALYHDPNASLLSQEERLSSYGLKLRSSA
ncbi:MAG: radical SAM protein, partial [candidate division Zixibacteria bacterium]|nr:radical SAM protein [candidate division Zixibacteria bacterium]